jgi:hypothetical protein
MEQVVQSSGKVMNFRENYRKIDQIYILKYPDEKILLSSSNVIATETKIYLIT